VVDLKFVPLLVGGVVAAGLFGSRALQALMNWTLFQELFFNITQWVAGIFFGFWRMVAGVVDIMEMLFLMFAGLEAIYSVPGDVYYAGMEGGQGGIGDETMVYSETLVTMIIRSAVVQNVFGSMLAVATVLMIFFTIIVLIRNQYKEKDGGNPYQVIFRMFKGMVMFLFITTGVIVGLMLSGIVFHALNMATRQGVQTQMSGLIFQSMSFGANRMRAPIPATHPDMNLQLRKMIDGTNEEQRDSGGWWREGEIVRHGTNFWVRPMIEGMDMSVPGHEEGNFIVIIPRHLEDGAENVGVIEIRMFYTTISVYQQGPSLPGGGFGPGTWMGMPSIATYVVDERPQTYNPPTCPSFFFGLRSTPEKEQIGSVVDRQRIHRNFGALYSERSVIPELGNFETRELAETAADATRHSIANVRKLFWGYSTHSDLTTVSNPNEGQFCGSSGSWDGRRDQRLGYLPSSHGYIQGWGSGTFMRIVSDDSPYLSLIHQITLNSESSPIDTTMVKNYTPANPVQGSERFSTRGVRFNIIVPCLFNLAGADDIEILISDDPHPIRGTLFGPAFRLGNYAYEQAILSTTELAGIPDNQRARRYAQIAAWIDYQMAKTVPDYWLIISEETAEESPGSIYAVTVIGAMTYNNTDAVVVLYYVFDMDWLIGWLGIFIIFGVMLNFTFALIQRVVELAVMYMMSPITVAMYPFDDGNAFSNLFVKPFYKKVIAVFAPVIAINLFFVMFPVFRGIQFFPEGNLFTGTIPNLVARTLVILALFSMLPAIRTQVQNMLGADAMQQKKLGEVWKESTAAVFGSKLGAKVAAAPKGAVVGGAHLARNYVGARKSQNTGQEEKLSLSERMSMGAAGFGLGAKSKAEREKVLKDKKDKNALKEDYELAFGKGSFDKDTKGMDSKAIGEKLKGKEKEIADAREKKASQKFGELADKNQKLYGKDYRDDLVAQFEKLKGAHGSAGAYEIIAKKQVPELYMREKGMTDKDRKEYDAVHGEGAFNKMAMFKHENRSEGDENGEKAWNNKVGFDKRFGEGAYQERKEYDANHGKGSWQMKREHDAKHGEGSYDKKQEEEAEGKKKPGRGSAFQVALANTKTWEKMRKPLYFFGTEGVSEAQDKMEQVYFARRKSEAGMADELYKNKLDWEGAMRAKVEMDKIRVELKSDKLDKAMRLHLEDRLGKMQDDFDRGMKSWKSLGKTDKQFAAMSTAYLATREDGITDNEREKREKVYETLTHSTVSKKDIYFQDRAKKYQERVDGVMTDATMREIGKKLQAKVASDPKMGMLMEDKGFIQALKENGMDVKTAMTELREFLRTGEDKKNYGFKGGNVDKLRGNSVDVQKGIEFTHFFTDLLGDAKGAKSDGSFAATANHAAALANMLISDEVSKKADAGRNALGQQEMASVNQIDQVAKGVDQVANLVSDSRVQAEIARLKDIPNLEIARGNDAAFYDILMKELKRVQDASSDATEKDSIARAIRELSSHRTNVQNIARLTVEQDYLGEIVSQFKMWDDYFKSIMGTAKYPGKG